MTEKLLTKSKFIRIDWRSCLEPRSKKVRWINNFGKMLTVSKNKANKSNNKSRVERKSSWFKGKLRPIFTMIMSLRHSSKLKNGRKILWKIVKHSTNKYYKIQKLQDKNMWKDNKKWFLKNKGISIDWDFNRVMYGLNEKIVIN